MTEGTQHGDILTLLLDELAERLAPRLAQIAQPQADPGTPWLTTTEAIEYTRLPSGTFKKLAACGKIPSHGGRTRLFYRPELDQCLLDDRGLAEDERRLRQVR
jgi:excisionase family DNA binding protein